jgi:hypothetical protein
MDGDTSTVLLMAGGSTIREVAPQLMNECCRQDYVMGFLFALTSLELTAARVSLCRCGRT